jgi:hypothetical protein
VGPDLFNSIFVGQQCSSGCVCGKAAYLWHGRVPSKSMAQLNG